MTAPSPPLFGVTQDGFVLKPFDAILADALGRARAVFGPSVDLTSTSPIRKLIEAGALEDAQVWQQLEEFYYGAFVSTATGDSLDLLGDDVGLSRRESFGTGTVTLTLTGGLPGRQYVVPEGTVLLAAGTGAGFATDDAISLSTVATTADVGVTAFARGAAGNVAAGVITTIDPVFRQIYLADWPPAGLTVVNAQPTSGGTVDEDDDTYRGRQLGVSRSLWTVEAARQAVLGVDGVLDVLLSDPLGGVDISQSFFNEFSFAQRLFSAERRIGEPYQFDVVVAHEFAWPWHTTGGIPGIFETVSAALDLVRPPGVHPNLIEADHIDIGVRAKVMVQPGYDATALLASIRARLAAAVAGLRLGGDVLFSQLMRAIVDEPGVIDVQQLHLRRYPPAFGRITFGEVFQQTGTVEAGVGENLTMGPTELPILRGELELTDIELVLP